jgi:ribonuclease VapC
VNRVVLDASAVLAVLNREPGSEVVEPVFLGATISAVNYSEVLKKIVEFGGEITNIRILLDRQSLNVVAFDKAHAIEAASILPQTSEFGLSFADRACVALGRHLDFVVFTAETRMSLPKLGIEVRLIRDSGKRRT